MSSRIKNRIISRAVLMAVFTISGLSVHGQQNPETEKTIQKGNDLYKAKQYEQAEATYKEVLNKEKTNTTAAFNRANSLFRQSKLDENKTALDEVIMNAENSNTELKGKAYYNQGVGYSTQKNLEASIEAYKNALRQNPNDNEARENLQKALMELKKRNPPPKPKENKKNQKQQKQQPKMNQKEAEQRLKLLEQKEKEVQQRLQNEKSKAAAGQPKDW